VTDHFKEENRAWRRTAILIAFILIRLRRLSMKALIDTVKTRVCEAAQNPAFRHHLWYVHYHLEIVERLAMELCDLYPSADRNLARLLRKMPMKKLFILPLILLTLGCQTLLSGSETKRDKFDGFYTAGFEVSISDHIRLAHFLTSSGCSPRSA
jgi:hypothetical protein